MERGNSKHSSREDDELKHELAGTARGNRPTRAEEWRGPEPQDAALNPLPARLAPHQSRFEFTCGTRYFNRGGRNQWPRW